MQDLRPVVRFVRLAHGAGLSVPAYATSGSAGLDLPSAETVEIPPGGRVLVSTGFRIELPPGYEGQIRPRSGLALKHGVTVLNSPGTIDSDYRGEVKVILINLNLGTAEWQEPYKIIRGERIAQMVVAPVSMVLVEETETVRSVSERGEGGFGSTERMRHGETWQRLPGDDGWQGG